MQVTEDLIQKITAELMRRLGQGPLAVPGASAAILKKMVVTESDVANLALAEGDSLTVPAGAIITPLAQDTLLAKKITLVRE